jgi:hypothetical protein
MPLGNVTILFNVASLSATYTITAMALDYLGNVYVATRSGTGMTQAYRWARPYSPSLTATPSPGTASGTPSATPSQTGTPWATPSACPALSLLPLPSPTGTGGILTGSVTGTLTGPTNTAWRTVVRCQAGGLIAPMAPIGTAAAPPALDGAVPQYAVALAPPPRRGTLYLDTCAGDTGVDTVLAVGYCNGPAAFDCVAVADDSAGCGNGLQSRLAVQVSSACNDSAIPSTIVLAAGLD